MINHHADLLRKYIAHVTSCEGTEFLQATYRQVAGDVSVFTDEEWAELRRLAGETGEEDAYEVEIWQEKLEDHAEDELEKARAHRENLQFTPLRSSSS